MENKSDNYTNCDRCSWYCHQRIGTRTGGFANRMSGDNPNDSITEIYQNTEKSRCDLRRLVVTQFPVKDHLLMLM